MSSNLDPTYHGYIGSTKDALLIIQQALNKQLDLVPRRPHERERPNLIKSGNVFVFIEEQSGIKRWTDGTSWSPSRILGRFLVYRELDKSSLNEKDDKKKKKRKSSSKYDQTSDSADATRGLRRDGDNITILNPQLQQPQQSLQQAIPSSRATHELSTTSELIPPNTIPASNTYSSTDYNKSLLSGPLVTSYIFKDQGLIKKTLSLTTTTSDLHLEKLNEKQTIHLISYYNAQEVMNGKLLRPSESDFKDVVIPASLWNAVKDSSLGGKIPIEDEAFYFLDGNYQLQSMLQSQQQQQQQQQQQPTQQRQQPPAPIANVTGAALNNAKLSYGKYGGPLPQQQQQQFQPRMGHQLAVAPLTQNDNSLVKREEDESGPTGTSDLNFINPFSGTQQQVPIYGASLGFMTNNGNAYNYSIQSQGSLHGQTQGYTPSQYNQYLQHNTLQMNPHEGYPQHFHPSLSQQQQQQQQQQLHSHGHQHQTGTPNSTTPAFQPPLPPNSASKSSTTMGINNTPGTSISENNSGGNTAPQYRLNSGSSVDQYSVGNNNSVSSINSGMYQGSLSNTTSTSSVLTTNSSFSVPAGSRKFSQQSSGGQVPTVRNLKSNNYTSLSQGYGATNSSSNTVTPSASLNGASAESAQTIPAAASSEIEPSQVHSGQFIGQYPHQPQSQHQHHSPQHSQSQSQHQSHHHPSIYHYQSPHQQYFQKWSNSPQQSGNGNGSNGAGFEDVSNSTPSGLSGQQSSYYPTSMQGPRF
ncbi:Wor1 transcriptional regulator [Candida orthopsilosis Co 90-125]|uniref:Wor1 transcriptional regulator n=1 Tax=Candida orthopsilosis (strain 90-125) TaxID=1136231 RepID=H8WXU3_CANO9|nr:Wor1 transcriptional regulator [Candida orthopsilosis Co 90-125]CCG20890.1 Wor1 transcriptional regulator [Candida orthopsilosis Co 90-125]